MKYPAKSNHSKQTRPFIQPLAKNCYYSRERFFPEDHRAFCFGELAVAMDRFGGLECITYLNSVQHNGKLYPGRKPIEYFSRNGKNLNRPFISPALRFVCEYSDSSVRTPCPEFPEIYPNGVTSKDYEFVLGQKSFSLQQCATTAGVHRYIATFSKLHYSCQSSLNTVYNQLAHEHVWLPPEYRGEFFDEGFPFPDGALEIKAIVPRYDAKSNAIIFCKNLAHPAYHSKLYFIVTNQMPLHLEENKNDWFVSTGNTEQASNIFSFGFGDSPEVALERAREAGRDHRKCIRSMEAACNSNSNAPSFSLEHYEEAERFAQVFPAYQKALICEETEKTAAIRAAYMKYGFFPIWDHIYPVRDFLISNEHKLARKCLAYMLDYPHWDSNPFVMIHLSLGLDEYLAFTKDNSLLDEFYPQLKKAFAFTETLVSQKTGLLRYGIDTAVDVMEELGLSKLFYASCVNGWWYDACCCLINFAKEKNDLDFEAKVSGYEKLISENYEDVFFDQRQGFLRAAVADKGQNMTCEVFLHTKSLPMDYCHGSWLFRRIMPQMSKFVMNRLLHPWGVSAVPYDSEAPCLYLKGTRMNQHLGHSCKLLRQANRVDGVQHLLNAYMYVFHQTQCAVETFNYNYCAGDQLQRADWQAFSATAAMQAIIQGALGLFWHRGGLVFIPADEEGENSINNFHFAGKKWNVKCSGKGNDIQCFTINGQKLAGSMQVPEDLVHDREISLEIRRGTKTDKRPCLLWAIGASICQLHSTKNTLEFTITNKCRAQFAIQTETKANLVINGNTVTAEYSAQQKRLWYAGDFTPGETVKLQYSEC